MNDIEKNHDLIEVMSPFIKLNKTKSYDDNLDLVIAYFVDHIHDFLSFLSSRTYEFLDDVFHNHPYEMHDIDLYSEDFAIIFMLGIVDVNDFSLNEKYKPVYMKMKKIKYHHVYINTVIKGLIDLYGYIEMNKLKTILKLYFGDNKNIIDYDNIYENINHNGIIRQFCKIRKSYVCRNEIYSNRFQFLNNRLALDKHMTYCIFPLDEVVKYSSSFILSPFKLAVPSNLYQEIFNHSFSLYLSAVNFIPNGKHNKKSINAIQFIDEDYPKWVLKGHSKRQYGILDNLDDDNLAQA